MKPWILLIAGAVAPFLFISAIQAQLTLILMLLTALLALLVPLARVYCLLPAFFLLTTLAINERLEQRLPLSKNRTLHSIEGTVASLPLSNPYVTSFIFEPDKTDHPLPARIRVSWFAPRSDQTTAGNALPEIHAGERWRLQLELRSPRSRVNFHGTDTERWYFTDGIAALGYVKQGQNIRLSAPAWFNLQHIRETLLEKLEQKVGQAPLFRILAALAIADRRGLLSSDRKIFSATGTGHLLAISGLHIGLAAAMGFYLGRLSLLLFGVRLGQQLAVVTPWVMAWLAALSYTALAGFGVSTQRALIMLSVATLVTLNRRNVHPLLAWMVAMALVLVFDPFAPMRAGFWFSFLAVLVLLLLFLPRHGAMVFWKRILLAQFGISMVMAPLGIYWFQQASVPGVLANLLAIPVVSFVIVPLILVGMVFLYMPMPIAEWALSAAAHTSGWLFQYLQWLAQFQPERFSSTGGLGLLTALLAMAGAAIVLLPRGMPGRAAGILLMLPLLWPKNPQPGVGDTQIDFLDVGQGLAVLLTADEYQLLYDTGPGNGLQGDDGWDLVESTIRPAIMASGHEPDLIVASHADLDHAGGLSKLQTIYSEAQFLASLPNKTAGIKPCNVPLAWQSNRLEFRVLHPSSGLPYLGNDSSCVISILGAGFKLLLSGDISHVVEKRLVAQGIEQHDVLTVPHHGSSSSSSGDLLEALRPSWALISSGINNRFDFPREDVLARYAKIHSWTMNTAMCGGIRVTFMAQGGVQLESARNRRKTLWRWPAMNDCP